MLQRVLKAESVLLKVERSMSALLLLSILVFTIAQVIARYVFSSPFVWTGELSRFSMVWLTFIAAAAALATDAHISVDIIGRRLKTGMNRVMQVGVHTLVLITCVILVPASWDFLQMSQFVSSPALDLSLGWLYGIVVVSFGLMALHTLLRVWELLAHDNGSTTEAGHTEEGAP